MSEENESRPELSPGKLLANFRKRAGLTQVGMAERLEISRTHLAKVETGKGDPGHRLVDRLVEAFDLYSEPAWKDEAASDRLKKVLAKLKSTEANGDDGLAELLTLKLSAEKMTVPADLDKMVQVVSMICDQLKVDGLSGIDLEIRGSVKGDNPKEEGRAVRDRLIFGLGKIPDVEMGCPSNADDIEVLCDGPEGSRITIQVRCASKAPAFPLYMLD
jgi:transcriptional regulator with XRE-family HTH domain